MNRKILILFVSLFFPSFLSAQNCQASFTYMVDSGGMTVSLFGGEMMLKSMFPKEYAVRKFYFFGVKTGLLINF